MNQTDSTPETKQRRESSVLDSIRKKKPDIKADLAKRSWRVTLLKWIFPAVALLLLIVLALAPEWHSGIESGRVTYHLSKSPDNETSSIENATYNGRDEQGQPYMVTASNIVQHSEGASLLTMPQGSIVLKSGAWLTLKSAAGRFDQKEDILDLTGNVMLYRNDGTIMTTSQATMNLHTSSAASKMPVQVSGPFGVLEAQNGFTLLNHGDQIMFYGPVKMVLDQTQ